MENTIVKKIGSTDEFGQEVLPSREDVKGFVTVLLSNRSPKVKKDFHCVNCGRIVFNYFSEVRIIIIDEVREVGRPVDILCSRCKLMYRVS